MQIQFSCPNCGRKLLAESRHAGGTATCPGCRQSLMVPNDSPAPATSPPINTGLPIHTGPSIHTRPPTSNDPLASIVVQTERSAAVTDRTDVPTRSATSVSIDPRRIAVPRIAVYVQAICLFASSIACLLIGYQWGLKSKRLPDAVIGEYASFEVAGRVNYVAEGGASLPDAGAVVMLLPEDRRPTFEDKFAANGLCPTDPEPEAGQQELAKVSQMGGTYGRTDDQGEFRLKVRAGGRYFVWIISKLGKRSANAEFSRAELGQISRYCTEPQAIVADRKYRWLNESILRDRRLVIELD